MSRSIPPLSYQARHRSREASRLSKSTLTRKRKCHEQIYGPDRNRRSTRHALRRQCPIVQRQCQRQLGLCRPGTRSEEHTSELQSLMRISYAVFCLNKKKNKEYITQN